ncbi:MAG: DUF84 family protein [Parachlamydiaceae bacterium]
MSSSVERIGITVGSANQVKIAAAQEVFLTLAAGREIKVTSFKAWPGISTWKSTLADGQPFGAKQTAFGAINRMNHCWRECHESMKVDCNQVYAVGFENGLVSALEIGHSGPQWFDVCFVAIKNESAVIIKRGRFVQTEFSPPANYSQEDFDTAVKAYQELIMPKLKDGKDLYLEWTKDSVWGAKTREHFLTECGAHALQELDALKGAQDIVGKCIESGMTASAGPRYNTMLWMRDLSYMTPVYLKLWAQENLLLALRNISQHQFSKHTIYDNDYETFDRFGNVPIVCIPEANVRSFLIQRIRGTMQDKAWQIQLWDYTQRMRPEKLGQFPYKKYLDGKEIKDLSLDSYSVEELKRYYELLSEFGRQLEKEGYQPPKASFALKTFMDGNLQNLTPGTRDSEIHYILTIFALIKHDLQGRESLLKEFAPFLAKALYYLYMNVVDNEDGLPRGADTRDIFADMLYDSKLLTNAVFLYQVLSFFVDYASDLQSTSFCETLTHAIRDTVGKKTPHFLVEMVQFDLGTIFRQEQERLKVSIQRKLLFDGTKFNPKDFIPGKRAGIFLDSLVNPSPIDVIVRKCNPDFVKGTTADPQALAQAVLTGLIPPEYYDEVIRLFAAADSKIGVQVFVPISGKTQEETELLQKVKGLVVWPHITWVVIRALIAMDTERSLNIAEEQRDKLMQLGGCSEWYAIDPDTQEPVKGGDPLQGWSASSMIMAFDDFYQHYSDGAP